MYFIANDTYLSLHTVRLEEHRLLVTTSGKKRDASTVSETTTFQTQCLTFQIRFTIRGCCKVTNTGSLPDKKVLKYSDVHKTHLISYRTT